LLLLSSDSFCTKNSWTALPQIFWEVFAVIQNEQGGCRRVIAVALLLLLLSQPAIAGQTNTGLRLVVIEGSGAQNITEQVPETSISVRLVDRSGNPVPNVAVVFSAPAVGPGGEFVNGMNTITVITNVAGIATTQLFHPNAVQGSFEIQVRALYSGETASTTIRQRNIGPKKSFSKKFLLIAAAGAAAGAAVALGNSGGSGGGGAAPPPPGGGGPPAEVPSGGAPAITFGGSSVGAPR
jgi:hypothetical protein